LLFCRHPRWCCFLLLARSKSSKWEGVETLPGRMCSSLISMVRVNVQPSGRGDRLASEYAVRIIAARNESSRACLWITAFTILPWDNSDVRDTGNRHLLEEWPGDYWRPIQTSLEVYLTSWE
jgi:hypothetical protein